KADVVEEDLRRVRRADAVLFQLGAHLEALGFGRDHERSLTAGTELGVDGGHDHVDVRYPPVGAPGLLTIQDPLVRGLVIAGASAKRGDIRPGIRLGHAEGADPGIIRCAVALRYPLAELLGRAGRVYAG